MVDNIKENCTSSSLEPVSLKQTEKIIEQMNNSICRINDKGTGFFVKIPYKSKLLPVLITTNQVINTDDIQDKRNISIRLNNDKKIKTIKLDNNRLKYTNEKLDITIIEIKENEDNLNNDYLELDYEVINYLKLDKIKLNKKESPNYLDESIYLLNYLKSNDIYVSYGKLININNNDIYHNCNIKGESSGSPILLINNQKLIGIHCNSSKHNKYNKGTSLIYSIIEFSKIKNNLLIIDKEGRNINHNYIICELNIKEDNQNIRIINSYEQSNRENKFIEYKKENENEKEIKDNCEIIINDELIPFSYFHKFSKKGKYTILYIFKKNITKTNYMFYKCSSLTNIDLSNFNTDNVKDMSCMFYKCSSLTNINLSYFNTNNVKDMSWMFYKCSSLTNINLSYFNTNNVINMSGMFNGCSSLEELNLSNFNTNNINNMNWMFRKCSSLTKINLSNFNTNNVKDMCGMFEECKSLTNIDISKFNTNKVTNMSFMFSNCSSLININLSNFNTNNICNMSHIFDECKKINKNNINTKDKRILNELNI